MREWLVVVVVEGGGDSGSGWGCRIVEDDCAGLAVVVAVDDDDSEDNEEEEDAGVGTAPRVRSPCATVRYQLASFSSAVATRRCSCGCEEQTLHSSAAEMARLASRLEVSTVSRVGGPE